MNFNVTSDEGKNKILLEINEDKNSLSTTSGIDIALEQAKLDIRLFDETIESVKTKILQKSGIQKNEVIELIYRDFI